MTEWNSYRLTDFLLFSRESLFEVYASYNHDLWPWQILWLVLALVLGLLPQLKSRHRSRTGFAILAAAWAWVAWFFHLEYFISINWAAKYCAFLFLAESFLIFYLGVIRGSLEFGTPSMFRRRIGMMLFVLAAFVPLEFAWGQTPAQILGFGWGPDRTALGTIGLLLNTRGRPWNGILMLPALLWGLIASIMYYGLS